MLKELLFSDGKWKTRLLSPASHVGSMFLGNVLLTSLQLPTLRTLVFVAKKERKIQQQNLHREKVTVWSAVHVNVVLGSYQFNF